MMALTSRRLTHKDCDDILKVCEATSEGIFVNLVDKKKSEQTI